MALSYVSALVLCVVAFGSARVQGIPKDDRIFELVEQNININEFIPAEMEFFVGSYAVSTLPPQVSHIFSFEASELSVPSGGSWGTTPTSKLVTESYSWALSGSHSFPVPSAIFHFSLSAFTMPDLSSQQAMVSLPSFTIVHLSSTSFIPSRELFSISSPMLPSTSSYLSVLSHLHSGASQKSYARSSHFEMSASLQPCVSIKSSFLYVNSNVEPSKSLFSLAVVPLSDLSALSVRGRMSSASGFLSETSTSTLVSRLYLSRSSASSDPLISAPLSASSVSVALSSMLSLSSTSSRAPQVSQGRGSEFIGSPPLGSASLSFRQLSPSAFSWHSFLGSVSTSSSAAAVTPSRSMFVVSTVSIDISTRLTSVSPTQAPSYVNTLLPTHEPTVGPAVPSSESYIPVYMPTPFPLVAPTPVPTGLPSVIPTVRLTDEPSIAGTMVPTVQMTTVITVSPSLPDGSPIVVPTALPTVASSALPTFRSSPTVAPSIAPTFNDLTFWNASAVYKLYSDRLDIITGRTSEVAFTTFNYRNKFHSGSCNDWQAFVRSKLTLPTDAFVFDAVKLTYYSENIFTKATSNVSFVCTTKAVVSELVSALQSGESKSLNCGDHVWSALVCPSSSVPIICVDCVKDASDAVGTCTSLTCGGLEATTSVIVGSCSTSCLSTRLNALGWFSSLEFGYTTQKLYPLIRAPLLVNSVTSSTASVLVNVSSGGRVYCAAFPSIGSQVTSTAQVKLNGYKSDAQRGAGNYSVVVKNLVASSSYFVYCYTEDYTGHQMTLADMLQTRIPAQTGCCRKLTFTALASRMSASAQSPVNTLTIDALPINTATVVEISAKSYPCRYAVANQTLSVTPKTFTFYPSSSATVATNTLSRNFVFTAAAGC
jgi:hypothetical protein